MARKWKIDLDKILLESKKSVKDLRYIIRNGKNDLKVLLKRGCVEKYLPYPIKKFESIAPLSPMQKNQIPSSPSKFDIEKEGFSRVPPAKQTIYRQTAIEKKGS